MFYDRYDVGQRLASKLIRYKNRNAVVYALPRGGTVVGFEVAHALKLPFDSINVFKINHPLCNEFGICAVTEDGEMVRDEHGLCGIEESWVETEILAGQTELNRRRALYRKNKPLLSPRGKIAILVDDGVATGLTIKAAIRTIRKRGPSKIIVAVPIAPHEVVEELRGLVDGVVVLKSDRSYLGSVGSYYTHFLPITDDEVLACLSELEKERSLERKVRVSKFIS